MIAAAGQFAVGLPLALQRAGWAALRCVVLTAALVAYGSIPSTPLVQSEVESQVEELAAETNCHDVRLRLRGSATRGCGAEIGVAGPIRRSRPTMSMAGPRVSLGLSLPLRC